MHSRYDRDQYIKINWENVDSEFGDNFDLEFQTDNFEYDSNSIMHYYSTAFSSNGQPTMVRLVSHLFLKTKPIQKLVSS